MTPSQKRHAWITALAALAAGGAWAATTQAEPFSPAFNSAVIERRETLSEATPSPLEGAPPPPDGPSSVKGFTHASTILVAASLEKTREALLRVEGLRELSTYLKRVEQDSRRGLIAFEGEIYKLKLGGVLKFERVAPDRLRYTVLQGHSQGLSQEIWLRPLRPDATLVRLSGAFRVSRYAPDFVVTRAFRELVTLALGRFRELAEKPGGPVKAAPGVGQPGHR